MSYWDDPFFEERMLDEHPPLIRLHEPPDLDEQLLEALRSCYQQRWPWRPTPLVLVTDGAS